MVFRFGESSFRKTLRMLVYRYENCILFFLMNENLK